MRTILHDDTTTSKIAAIGMFDGVHAGHCKLIDRVRELGDRLGLVPSVVTFSVHPREIVNPGEHVRMLGTVDDRLRWLGKAGIEDVILLDFNERLRAMTAREFMTMLRDRFNVRALVVGFNHRFGRDRSQGFDDYVAIGHDIGVSVYDAEEYRCREEQGVSSSAIRRLLSEHQVEAAAQLLGHPYYITGTVVHGKELGRTIGFPTANIVPCDNRVLVPANGVYAVLVDLPDGIIKAGILNIGHRPTVDSDDAPRSIEVHILDYNGYLYEKPVTVHFVKWLRHEHAFSSVEELRRQLQADAEEARKIL